MREVETSGREREGVRPTHSHFLVFRVVKEEVVAVDEDAGHNGYVPAQKNIIIYAIILEKKNTIN